MSVEFKDYSIQVKGKINDIAVAWLHEACGKVQAQTARNTKVRTGYTKGSWTYQIDENAAVGYIGSNAQNAIWEEFGTGEYALNGNGRKGGWFYVDERGKGHFTTGKKPRRTLYKAFISLKVNIIASAGERFRNIG